MRKLIAVLLLLPGVAAYGQFGRGAGDWSTGGADAHRSSWVPADPKISPAGMQKPGFQFLWTMKLGTLTTPALLSGYIGYKGFRTLGFVGSSDTVYGIDTDLARLDWQKQFPASSTSPSCAGGMTANVTRSVSAAFPAAPDAGRGGGGRGGRARSAVGEPGEGAAILAIMEEQARRAAATPPPVRAAAASPGGRGEARTPNFVYALSSDGMLHGMYVSNGEEPDPPVRFLAANANATGLTVVGGVAYAVTTRACGGVENGVWALDLGSKKIVNWPSGGGEVAGWAGPAFGPDNTLYVATTQGSLVALDPKTLAPKDAYIMKGQAFTSSPVALQYKEKTLLAATTKDGRIHLLDPAKLNETPLHITAEGAASGALATWTQSDGTHWLLSSSSKAIVAWKVAEKDGIFSLQPGWTSREIPSPLTPMVINGVAFAVSGTSPVLYAMDAASGKELWNSGTKIVSPVREGTLAGGGSQVYLGTQDGTLYVFGYPLEH